MASHSELTSGYNQRGTRAPVTVCGCAHYADIAGQLVLSEATVKTHLNRTMTKLGLSSRARAVVVAYESGLVTPTGRHDSRWK